MSTKDTVSNGSDTDDKAFLPKFDDDGDFIG